MERSYSHCRTGWDSGEAMYIFGLATCSLKLLLFKKNDGLHDNYVDLYRTD